MVWHGGTQVDEQQRMLRDAILAARMHRHWATVEHGLAQLYPAGAAPLVASLGALVSAHVAARPAALFARDLTREADPTWFQAPDQIGYVCYTDLFAGTLAGVADRLP